MRIAHISLLLASSALVLVGCTQEKESSVFPSGNLNTQSDQMLQVQDNSAESDAEVVINEEQTMDDTMTETAPAEHTVVTLKTSMGDVTVELFDADAPKTVNNFLKLVKSDFYDGVSFHRVIPDFMIQGGDPLSKDSDPNNDGTGGPGYFFDDEINDHKIVRGTLAMANAGPNTNGSQFFIVTAEATPWLDGKHTVFGQVTDGQDIADAISQVDRDGRDRPNTPVVIEDIVIE